MIMHAIALWVSLSTVTLGAMSGPSAQPSGTRKERIDVLWLDAAGTSGRIDTVPMYLDDAPGAYVFGPRFCGKGHRVGSELLGAFHRAQAAGQPVRIDAEPVESSTGATRQCVSGAAFFAPIR